jgi:phage shock protein A
MAKFHTARPQRRGRGGRQLTEQERLIQKYHQLEQDIVTYENNIGFFAMSKASEPLIKQMEQRIAEAKKELEALAAQIRELAEAKDQE